MRHFHAQAPDIAVDWVQFIVQDPSKLDENSSPQTVCVVEGFLKKLHPVLFSADKLATPISRLLDEEIVTLFYDDLQDSSSYAEVFNYSRMHTGFIWPTRTFYNCSLCGGGLNLDFCHGCDREYKDDLKREAWQFPLPSKIVDLLIDHGHQFEQDPQLAWQAEKEAVEFPIFGLGG